MRPWYAPSSYGEDGGPLMVKCHSNRFISNGAAVRDGSGEHDNSRDS